MILTNNIKDFLCFSEANIVDALDQINRNKSRIVFVVSEHGYLLGSVSDGDFRRWFLGLNEYNLNVTVKAVMNKEVHSLRVGAEANKIDKLFKDGVDCIPLLNDAGHLVQLAFENNKQFFVGSREISSDVNSFIIAEIGNNHQGSLELAKILVDHAVEAKVDCVKFQMRSMDDLYKNSGNADDISVDLGAQYTMDLLSKYQLSNEELIDIFEYSKEKGVIPLCTPWDLESLKELEKYGMDAYKVASADFTNYELLEQISRTGKPFFCSTGMSSELEIKQTVSFLDSLGANYVLLHCNSTYPTPYKDVNLKYLTRLKKITGKLVGYSGHERGISMPVASVALGACVIEKHLTIDKSLEGTDHKVSLLPNELKRMVQQIRQVEEGLGSDEQPREITQGELLNRENLAKSLVSNRKIEIGSVITRGMIEIKSPGQGLQPNSIQDLIGKTANRTIEKNSFFYLSDIFGAIEKRKYSFRRPVGVPVRYHDFKVIIEGTNLDFVEFHLSYKDLEVNLKDHITLNENIGFAVHSPELFENDHILDLCSENIEYTNQSIAHLQSVIDITHDVNSYFPKTKKPVVIVNAGGWNPDGFLSESKKKEKYKILSDSLKCLDMETVTVAIQTMPPFPWHFGGQSYHNLFVDPDEIVEFCSENPKIKICLDISHSMMACNYYGWDLLEFVSKVAEFNVHMHIVDAKGADGEGVDIGKGDVDFKSLFRLLDKVNPKVPFIPEVWQGHKNGGEGFWSALEYLEKINIENN